MKEINSKINPTKVLQTTNYLRIVGLKNSHKGTKLISKAVQYVIVNDIEFFTLEEIYDYLHSLYNFNERTIKNNINNALTNRNIKMSENNFEKVFHYDYDVSVFEPKTFIEEIVNIVNVKV